MKRLTILFLTLCLLLSLTACGASSQSKTMNAAQAPAAAEEYAMDAVSAEGAALAKSNASGSTPLPEGRKWIITIDMSVETDDLDKLLPILDDRISALEGYVQDQSIYNGSTSAPRRYRNASLTVRIPDEKVDQFTTEMADFSNVVSQNLRREDITLQYVSTDSRVTALKTEEARLLELLAKAETTADLLEIEARLSDVRFELEQQASQLRIYDNQIDYATIYLYINEVQEYTPAEEPGFFDRITDGFSDSLKGLGEGAVDLVVWIIVSSPYLLVFGGIAAVAFRIVKKAKAKKAKKQAPKSEDAK